MKLTFQLIILLVLFFSCNNASYIYRKPVVGLIYYDRTPLANASVIYDSDILSPRNIVTNKNGQFILPKIEMKNYQNFIKSIKGRNSIIIITKEKYNTKKINLKNYDIGNDTIDVGVIYLKK